MRWFLPTFAVAAWFPHVEGSARWVVLGVFLGFMCLMLREA